MSPNLPHPLWKELNSIVQKQEPEIRSLRRYLHQHPEPSNEEYETTNKVAGILKEEGIDHQIAPSGRGLVANAAYQNGKKRIALRADMDALRIQDEKKVDYRSTKANLMHACGHDAHTSMLVGAVKALAEFERRHPKVLTWRAIFQPAEETATGALEMIGWGVMQDVDAVFGLHVDPFLSTGQVSSRPGPLSAICEEFEITIQGRGGHGARPHQTIDPIAAGTQLVNQIYEQLPRQVEEPEPSVVSIGVFQAGINSNVIPESAKLRGTIRSITEARSAQIKDRIQEIATNVEQATGATIVFERRYHLPSVTNNPDLLETWMNLAAQLCGEEQVIRMDRPTMGGEDFAYYLNHAPGCMLRLGVGKPGGPTRGLHSAHFDIDENALVLGSQLLALCALTTATN
ncbi:MAG: M20 family metallopeptidase [Verrucomicrobia bacterium]|nr:M20 family metallopeptidase [Verrucomicrobiota bacterium]